MSATPSARSLRRAVLAALALLLALAAAEAWQWGHKAALQQALARGGASADSTEPLLQFAHAQALAARLDFGPDLVAADFEAAQRAWRRLQDDPQLGAAARFNGANLLLRQAQALHASDDANRVGQALPLAELAKEQYRALLRADPGFWDARYNLDRAQRLQPDVEVDESEASAPRAAERAPTRMRGQALGLP